jgi:CheY-like chemotaxis protein
MRTILIVEDEPHIRRFVSANLKARGYTVLEAGSAEEGLEKLRDGTAQAVILDIRLPGMNGWDLLSAMSYEETIRQVPVIVMTASTLSGDTEHAKLYSNVVAVLIKPISAATLLDALSRYLGGY